MGGGRGGDRKAGSLTQAARFYFIFELGRRLATYNKLMVCPGQQKLLLRRRLPTSPVVTEAFKSIQGWGGGCLGCPNASSIMLYETTKGKQVDVCGQANNSAMC